MEYKKTLNKMLGLRESNQGKDNLWESESHKLGFRLIGVNVVAAHCWWRIWLGCPTSELVHSPCVEVGWGAGEMLWEVPAEGTAELTGKQ